MRIETADVGEKWFVLRSEEEEGGVPEGNLGEWLDMLAAMAEGQDFRAKRLGFNAKESLVFSPRNSSPSEGVHIADIKAFITMAEAEILPNLEEVCDLLWKFHEATGLRQSLEAPHTPFLGEVAATPTLRALVHDAGLWFTLSFTQGNITERGCALVKRHPKVKS